MVSLPKVRFTEMESTGSVEGVEILGMPLILLLIPLFGRRKDRTCRELLKTRLHPKVFIHLLKNHLGTRVRCRVVLGVITMNMTKGPCVSGAC